MVNIVNVKDYSGGLDTAVDYIHGIWGNERNHLFYKDAKKSFRFYAKQNII